MAITADSDLDLVFGSTDEFAVEVIFDTTPPLTVNAIWTGATDETTTFGMAIEAQRPTLMCRTSEIGTVRPKNTVEVDGTDYIVERVERVGQGVSVVYLKT